MSREVVADSRAFIRAARLPSGAIASHTDKTFIDPYLANQAVLGLAASRDSADRQTLLDYFTWYAARAEAGVISDYDLVAGEERATGDQDSQDAYAGTFLSAWSAAMRTASQPERRRLARFKPTVRDSVRLIASLQDVDGLTWAKPTWRVKYLMDQVEVYWGLSEASPFLRGEPALRKLSDRSRAALAKGIKGLWNAKSRLFADARHEDGSTETPTATVPFPDAISQVWVISTDLVGKRRARAVMNEIRDATVAWLTPSERWLVDGKTEPVGYWPVTAIALRRTGQVRAADDYIAALVGTRADTAAAWPYNVAIAGHLATPRTLTTSSRPR